MTLFDDPPVGKAISRIWFKPTGIRNTSIVPSFRFTNIYTYRVRVSGSTSRSGFRVRVSGSTSPVRSWGSGLGVRVRPLRSGFQGWGRSLVLLRARCCHCTASVASALSRAGCYFAVSVLDAPNNEQYIYHGAPTRLVRWHRVVAARVEAPPFFGRKGPSVS